jgi:CopG family transcriptional regulator, nickel-responsive regulator
MDNVTRIGVSLEPELLVRFDELIGIKGYATRSEAIRDLIRKALVQESLKESEAHAVGTITLLYNHHRGSINESLTEIQHRHHAVISSSIHIHLDLERCLEVLVVHGTVGGVKRLSEELAGVKDVLNTEPVIIAGELSEHHHE